MPTAAAVPVFLNVSAVSHQIYKTSLSHTVLKIWSNYGFFKEWGLYWASLILLEDGLEGLV